MGSLSERTTSKRRIPITNERPGQRTGIPGFNGVGAEEETSLLEDEYVAESRMETRLRSPGSRNGSWGASLAGG